MTISSMTGFARARIEAAPWRFAWEIKTVNAKGLDLRLRVPPGFDAVEIAARARLGAGLARGSCFASLVAQRDDDAASVRVNRKTLDALLAAVAEAPLPDGLRPASLDGLLSIKGVIETTEPEETETSRAARDGAALAALDDALLALLAARREEGAALSGFLTQRLDAVERLAASADQLPARAPESIRARLAEQIAALVGASAALDPQRLHQEAVLLAVKADIREEIDRLKAHVASARALLAGGGPIGRRLDFLAQEMSRETNTLCAKSNDAGLTAIGLELKVEVEQWREQAQNVE